MEKNDKQSNKAKLHTVIAVCVLVIIVPIVFHKVSALISGQMMAKMMSMPAKVETSVVEEKDIYETADYVGRIQAPKEVKIVSRVSGWLQKKFYNDGDYVKKGQLLFQIEPDEYAIAVKNAEAALRRVQASYENSLVELNRAKELVKGDYVSRSYYDQAFAKYSSDKASVDAARADLAKKRLDLSYTKIYAPFDGKIGELNITEGNYVTAQTGELATLVTIDPVFATFTAKNEELNKYKNEGHKNIFDNVNVSLKLSDGSEYNEAGKLDFMDNQIDKDLGTLTMRATFANKNHTLIPNDFVRVIITSKFLTKVVIVPQDAVLESLNGKYVWALGEDNVVKQQDIEVSGSYGRNWIVKSGLKVGDVVVSSNIQSVRQGSKVQVIELTPEQKAEKAVAREEAEHSNMTDRPNQKKKITNEEKSE